MTISFSVCIPNFNYAQYVGDTIRSVFDQHYSNVEICISDNSSTDDSVDVIRSFTDTRIKLRVNRWNVGFAGNLDRAAALATGDAMIMLSSDDVMASDALDTYANILGSLSAEKRRRVVITSSVAWINAKGQPLGIQNSDAKIWNVAEPDPTLTTIAGGPVLRADAGVVLRRSLELMRSPLPFLSTCYSRTLYDRVEGYGGGRLVNPDKWFAWKVLSVAEEVIFVNRPLFEYRWHDANQTAQQAQSGALKHLVDQYVNTFELSPEILSRAGLTQECIIAAFVEQDVALRNLERVAEGKRRLARRGLYFGIAAYPAEARRNWKVWALRLLLALGPVGSWLARLAMSYMVTRWNVAHGAKTTPVLRAK